VWIPLLMRVHDTQLACIGWNSTFLVAPNGRPDQA
jgi:hypothetical protein